MSYKSIINSLKRGINVDTGTTHYVFGPDFDVANEGYSNAIPPWCQPANCMPARTLVETKLPVTCQRCLKKLFTLTKTGQKTEVKPPGPRPLTLGDQYKVLFTLNDRDGVHKVEFDSYNDELIATLREACKRSTLPGEFEDDDIVLMRLAKISDWPK